MRMCYDAYECIKTNGGVLGQQCPKAIRKATKQSGIRKTERCRAGGYFLCKAYVKANCLVIKMQCFAEEIDANSRLSCRDVMENGAEKKVSNAGLAGGIDARKQWQMWRRDVLWRVESPILESK